MRSPSSADRRIDREQMNSPPRLLTDGDHRGWQLVSAVLHPFPSPVFCSWEGVDADASLSDRIHQSDIEFRNASWVFAGEIQEVCPHRSLE